MLDEPVGSLYAPMVDQGQDERARTRLPRPPRAALTWRGGEAATRTDSAETRWQTLDRQQDRGELLHCRGKQRFGNRLGDSVGASRGGGLPQVAPFFVSKKPGGSLFRCHMAPKSDYQ
jgi:hypothetical protein